MHSQHQRRYLEVRVEKNTLVRKLDPIFYSLDSVIIYLLFYLAEINLQYRLTFHMNWMDAYSHNVSKSAIFYKFCFVTRHRVLLYIPMWPRILYTDQAGTQLTGVHLPLPASQVLRLKAGATMPVSFLQNLTVIYDLHGVQEKVV